MIKIVCKLFGGRNFRPLCHKMENAEQFAQFAEIFLLRKSVLCWPSIKLLYLCVSLIVVNNKHYFQFVYFRQIAIDEQVNISKVRQLLRFFGKQLCERQWQSLNTLDFFLSRISKKKFCVGQQNQMRRRNLHLPSQTGCLQNISTFIQKVKLVCFIGILQKAGQHALLKAAFAG